MAGNSLARNYLLQSWWIFRQSFALWETAFPLSLLYYSYPVCLCACLPSSLFNLWKDRNFFALSLGKLQSVSNQSYNYIYWLINCSTAAIQLEFFQSHTRRESVVLCQLVHRLTCLTVQHYRLAKTATAVAVAVAMQLLPYETAAVIAKSGHFSCAAFFLRHFMQLSSMCALSR